MPAIGIDKEKLTNHKRERKSIMTCKLIVEEATEITPEGEYTSKPINMYEKTGPHGAMIHIDFRLLPEDEYDGCVVSGIASKKLTENTKLGRWIGAILGRLPEPGETITEDALLHKECRVIVKHKKNAEGRTFANVVQVLPATVNTPPEDVAETEQISQGG
jgi:hypothetical protein